MAKLLIVDDEEKIREVVREYAEFDGYEVTEAADGREAVALCRINDFDIIIMDIMMPKLDGFSACKEIRKEKNTPVIMMSARSEEYDKLFGFELGIDDDGTKPFSPKELMARVHAVLARSAPAVQNDVSPVLTFGGLTIDIPGRSVSGRFDGSLDFDHGRMGLDRRTVAFGKEKIFDRGNDEYDQKNGRQFEEDTPAATDTLFLESLEHQFFENVAFPVVFTHDSPVL